MIVVVLLVVADIVVRRVSSSILGSKIVLENALY